MEESMILSEFDRLVRNGVVLYDDTQESIELDDGELKFRFILTSALAKKPTMQVSLQQADHEAEKECVARNQRREGSDIGTLGFEIGDIGATHFLAANKFCFARPHLMLLTSDAHHKQYKPLNETDFRAVWSILAGIDREYVAFYNCGQDGGCSRLHKHVQLMPMPENSFAAFLDAKGGEETKVPFQWYHHRFESQHVTPADVIKVYDNLLKQAAEIGKDCSEHAHNAPTGAACPHNMILTKHWMLVLPRRRAAINKEAGVNALGMLGVIAVATKNEIDNWVRLGPTQVLRELGVPK